MILAGDEMDENAVKVIVQEAFDGYEAQTGKPRHEQNLTNFKDLFGAMNWLKGAGAAIGLILMALQIYALVKKG